MKIGAIVQARMGSTRLPGKVMRKILGKPVLWHIINRLKQAELISQIVVATSTYSKDKVIVEWCKKNGVDVFAGNEEDVLDRFYQAANKFKMDVIVRITADCPLIDPKEVDKLIKYYLEHKDSLDYTGFDKTYPDGFNGEVFSYQCLERAWKKAKLPSEREHVTPYIWKNKKRFCVHPFSLTMDWTGVQLKNIPFKRENLNDLLLSIDEEKDLRVVRKIFSHFKKDNPSFTIKDVLLLVTQKFDQIKPKTSIYGSSIGYRKSLEKDKRK